MKSLRAIRVLCLAFFLMFIFAARVVAVPMDLSPRFNEGVTLPVYFVSDIAVQPDNKIIISGNFSGVNGRSNNCLARLNADGSLDANFNIGVGCRAGMINAVALQVINGETKILIGGDFTAFGTTDPLNQRGRLARLNADGSLDETFLGLSAFGPSPSVEDIAVQPDGKILIASFNMIQYNGTPVPRFARVNTDGSLDTAFNANLGAGFDNSTKKIFIQDDEKILVGGSFTKKIARLDKFGNFDAAFSANIGTGAVGCSGCTVSGIEVDANDNIVIVGGFSDFNAVPRAGVARLNSAGMLDMGFTSPVSNSFSPQTVVIEPFGMGKIIVSGAQTGFNDGVTTRNNVARLNPADGSIDPTFNIGAGTNSVHNPSSFLKDGKLLVGGAFTFVSGKIRLALVRFETNGDTDLGFKPVIGANGYVNALAVQTDNRVIVGGNFYGAGNALALGLARYSPNGKADTTFQLGGVTDLTAMDVRAIAVQPSDGKILIGGNFTNLGGVPISFLVRLNPGGDIDMHFPAVGFIVNAIVIQPGTNKIIVGGDSGLVTNRIARLDPITGAADAGFVANIPTIVNSLTIQPSDGKILVGGNFNTVNGTAGINNIARLNPADGSRDMSFTTGSGFDAPVVDIEVQTDNKILAVGSFGNFNTVPSAGIARLNAGGSYDTSFNVGTGFSHSPSDILVETGGTIVVAGDFGSYNGMPRIYLARLNADGSLHSSLNTVDFASSPNNQVNRLAMQASGGVIVGGAFSQYSDKPRFGIARLRGFGTCPNPYDDDFDDRADFIVYRTSDTKFYTLRSSFDPYFQTRERNWGSPGDRPFLFNSTQFVSGSSYAELDYGIFRPASGDWWIRAGWETFPATQISTVFHWGLSGDLPMPGDYDGDCHDDFAVWRPQDGNWFVAPSSGTSANPIIFHWGLNGDHPVSGDFDGDGKNDFAIFRENGSLGEWWIRNSRDDSVTVTQYGLSTDQPVPADYDGDGKTDLAVFRLDGTWFYKQSRNGVDIIVHWGLGTDTPVPADYDGDGLDDIAVYRNGEWWLHQSDEGDKVVYWGVANDIPMPAALHY